MLSAKKHITFLKSKLNHLDNNLFKLMVRDIVALNMHVFIPGRKEELVNKTVKASLDSLERLYKAELKKLYDSEKKASKQIDLEDSIREIQQTPVPEECFCGCKDLNNEQEHTKERLACNI